MGTRHLYGFSPVLHLKCSSLGSNPHISKKIPNGPHKQKSSQHTLAAKKIYLRNALYPANKIYLRNALYPANKIYLRNALYPANKIYLRNTLQTWRVQKSAHATTLPRWGWHSLPSDPEGAEECVCVLHCTENAKQIFQEMKLRVLVPNFCIIVFGPTCLYRSNLL